MSHKANTRYVVDRREGKYLVLERDDGTIVDVEATKVPIACRGEGTVFDVPFGEWAKAVRNRDEELRRNREGGKVLDQLKKKDPGGDMKL